jgi:signal transduction histidine kinase
MARQIVEMHGGRIWFESKAGVGSEFHFSVPMQTTRDVPVEQRMTPEAA